MQRLVLRRCRGRSPHRPTPVDHPFAGLRGLAVPNAPGDAVEPDDAIESIVDAEHEAFAIDEVGRVIHDGRAVAVLVRGADILHPELRVIGLDDHGGGAVARVGRRLRAWARDAITELTAPLAAIGTDGLPGSARGLLYQLERGLGTLDGLDARAQIDALAPDVVVRLENGGVLVGREAVHVVAMATPEHLRLRAALWIAFEAPDDRPVVPDGRALSIAASPEIDPSYLLHTGYIVRGPRAIRGDALARLDVALLHAAADGDEPARAELGGRLGVRRRDLAAVIRALMD